eukprot:4961927-Amphidinium_carterae.1
MKVAPHLLADFLEPPRNTEQLMYNDPRPYKRIGIQPPRSVVASRHLCWPARSTAFSLPLVAISAYIAKPDHQISKRPGTRRITSCVMETTSVHGKDSPEMLVKGTPLNASKSNLSVLSYNLLAPLFVRPIDLRTGVHHYPASNKVSLLRSLDLKQLYRRLTLI